MNEVRAGCGSRDRCPYVGGDSYNQIGPFIICVFNAPLRRFGNHENGRGNETETD